MISRLRGVLATCELTDVTIDVNGVGYAVFVPLSTFDRLPRVGESVELLIHTYVREDCIQLFGFYSPIEKALFRMLLGASGIGPKLALNILSTFSAGAFAGFILEGDVKSLSKVNGLGKRTAEKLIIELREKIGEVVPEAALGLVSAEQGKLDADAQDAIAALQTLGFKPEQARKAVLAVIENSNTVKHSSENLIRIALSSLNS